MALVYQSICYEADTLLLQIMSLAEKEIKYKVEIEKMMTKGFVNIAKARYIMGSTCVTKMQLPTENSNAIRAVATVCRTEANNHMIFHIHRKDGNKKSENSSPNQGFDDGDKENISIDNSEAAFKNLLHNDPKALKKSKTAYHVNNKSYKDLNEEMLDEMSTDSESTDSLQSVTDPIRLFGVLVPNALKEAQVHFKDVVNLIGKCATLQSELQEALERYNHLLKVKNLIEAAAKDIKMNISVTKVYWTPSDSAVSCHSIEEPEEEEEEEGEGSPGRYSVQKSIRSVIFVKEVEPEEPEEQLVWSSENTEYSSEEK